MTKINTSVRVGTSGMDHAASHPATFETLTFTVVEEPLDCGVGALVLLASFCP